MKSENYAFAGKVLRINLTTKKIWTEPIAKYTEKFLGGRGVDNWILYEEVRPWVTPFDPANRLIFGSGVLVGTLAPTASRLSVDGKSPMTGGIGAANSCGDFASEMKYAGYDHIVVRGRSKSPVYIWIDDDRVQIRDASHIWGKTTRETDDLIKQDIGDTDIQITCIGPAGENLVRGACLITNRGRAAGRCGLGAVMGSKNLKAVAVRGSQAVQVANPQLFMDLVKEYWKRLISCETGILQRKWGVYKLPEADNQSAMFSVRNFYDDYWSEELIRKMKPEVFQQYELGRVGYGPCPFYCSHFYRVPEGPYAGTACEGFVTNDICNWAARFELDYPPAIIKLHCLCNDLGLDQDNTSGVIGWAFECYERGIFNLEDTDGLKLKWGDYGVVVEMVRKIAHREGIGDLLAEGAKRAAEIVGKGSDEFAIHVKGQDNMESMRGAKSWALGCLVSTRGGTHTRGANLAECMPGSLDPEVSQRIWGIPTIKGATSYENKAELVVYYEKLSAISDSLGICLFLTNWAGLDLLGPEELAKLYSAATGNVVTADELMKIGERIHNVEKAFNVLHMGFSRVDDYPPQRFEKEPIKSGPMKGELLDREQVDKMLDRYYELYGWHKETGWQTRESLEALGLQSVADDLEAVARLPH